VEPISGRRLGCESGTRTVSNAEWREWSGTFFLHRPDVRGLPAAMAVQRKGANSPERLQAGKDCSLHLDLRSLGTNAIKYNRELSWQVTVKSSTCTESPPTGDVYKFMT
jgi:hypothetical protein